MKRVFLLLLLTCSLFIAPAAAAGGSGTAADPYIIQTAAELQSIQNNLAAYYKLANDINLQGVSFTPIGSQSTPFIGSFDGAGHTISNLVISSSTQFAGLFSCLGSGATVKDVTFQDCSVSASSWCGVVIGKIVMSSSAHKTAVISNVDCVRCSASASGSNIGCLVGMIRVSAVVEIVNCDVSYSITESASGTSIGCLVGVCGESSSLVIDSSTVQNCIVSGSNIGCLVGVCYEATSVNALNCDVMNCLAKGGDHIGGLYGINWGGSFSASDCTVTGCTIVATRYYAGGIAGRISSGNLGIFSGCSVTDSTIIAPNYAAGICPAYS